MAQFKLEGLGVALVTPFKSDKSIDFEALGRLVDFQIESGVDFLVVLGTTGETPTLSPDEQQEIRSFIRRRVAGKIPLVLGLGGNDTAGVVRALRNTDVEGYEAILSVVPQYNKPSQEGIYRHFAAIAEAGLLRGTPPDRRHLPASCE